MRAAFAILMIIDVYVIIYYRLLVRFHYEQATKRRERAFGVLFSLPPYRVLPERGRRYVQRYWVAVFVLLACAFLLALSTDLVLTRHG